MTPLQRVVVVGCSGAGKSIFSAALALRLGVPHVERDLLGALGSETYRSAVHALLDTDRWVFDGPPYFVDEEVYSQAELVLWLDYARPLVLWRAIQRALRIKRLRHWIEPGGPRFANAVFSARRREFATLQHRTELKGKVLRFGTPAEAQDWLLCQTATVT